MPNTPDAPTDAPTSLPVACSLDPAALARRRSALRAAVFNHVRGVEEQRAGYVLHFTWHEGLVDTLEGFAALERECCPFIEARIEEEPEKGSARLILRGTANGKRFLSRELVAPFLLKYHALAGALGDSSRALASP